MRLVAPQLETDRLLLRPFRREDFPALVSLWSDPLVMKHVLGRASTEEETWARLLRYAGLWPLLGYGYWAVEERSTGRYVGDVGFADFRRDMTPSFGDAPEAGWVLAAWAHGKGFATEAVRAAHAWSDAHIDRPGYTVCMIAPQNAASIGVALKCGYMDDGRGTYKGNESLLFRRRLPPDETGLPPAETSGALAAARSKA